MVSPVDSIIEQFLEAGASVITFHPEASAHIDRSLQLIKDGGAERGLGVKSSNAATVFGLCYGLG